MKKTYQWEQPVKAELRPRTHFQANTSNRVGNVQSVILENRMINANSLPETTDTIRESLEEAFGKLARRRNDYSCKTHNERTNTCPI